MSKRKNDQTSMEVVKKKKEEANIPSSSLVKQSKSSIVAFKPERTSKLKAPIMLLGQFLKTRKLFLFSFLNFSHVKYFSPI